MRLEKSGPRYFSFQELAPNKPPKKKKEIPENQKQGFAGKCRVCGSFLTYIEGTNVMVCSNPDCKGIRVKQENEENEKKENVENLPVFRTMSKRDTRQAQRLFG